MPFLVIVTCRIIGAICAPMPSVTSFPLAIIRHILSPLSSLIELRFVYWYNSYNSFCDLPTISCPECSKVKKQKLKALQGREKPVLTDSRDTRDINELPVQNPCIHFSSYLSSIRIHHDYHGKHIQGPDFGDFRLGFCHYRSSLPTHVAI